MIVPVILAGGSGTRLWPLSRQSFPKQFLNLVDSKYTMLQLTLKRLEKISAQVLAPIIVCSEEHRFIVAEQLRKINIKNASIILEPCAKNTAPAITLAALHSQDLYPEHKISFLVLSADHHIENIENFHTCIIEGLQETHHDKLVVFGVKPTYPHTGYGYIKIGNKKENIYELDKFVEKPDLIKAESYISSGNYLWNSGIFMFSPSLFLQEIQEYQNEIYYYCLKAWDCKTKDLDFIRVGLDDFIKSPENSIDYSVMEHTQHGAVVYLDAKWNDLGSWCSLWESNPKDNNQNVIIGDVIVEKSQLNYICSSSRLVTVLGIENLVVVETKDAVLIAHKDMSQEIKKIVDKLKHTERQELLQHREVVRPWGKYDCIDIGERYQVKRITVNAKAKLSLQLHHHRAEHWVVVKGTAKVTQANKQYFVSENESTFIPLGTVHSLENPGSIPLELIEIQSGSYLGEDDIVRFKDEYGRK